MNERFMYIKGAFLMEFEDFNDERQLSSTVVIYHVHISILAYSPIIVATNNNQVKFGNKYINYILV